MRALAVGVMVFMGAAFVLAWALCRAGSQADEMIERMLDEKRRMDERRAS